MPAPLGPPSALGEIGHAETVEGVQEERVQESNGVQARYGRNDVQQQQQQQQQQQGDGRVDTMQFGGWGGRAGGGGFIMEVAEAEGVSGPLWMNKEGGRGWRGRRRSNKA